MVINYFSCYNYYYVVDVAAADVAADVVVVMIPFTHSFIFSELKKNGRRCFTLQPR